MLVSTGRSYKNQKNDIKLHCGFYSTCTVWQKLCDTIIMLVVIHQSFFTTIAGAYEPPKEHEIQFHDNLNNVTTSENL